MSRAIRPGMTSGGTTKLIQDTTTNRPEINIQVQIQICNINCKMLQIIYGNYHIKNHRLNIKHGKKDSQSHFRSTKCTSAKDLKTNRIYALLNSCNNKFKVDLIESYDLILSSHLVTSVCYKTEKGHNPIMILILESF